MLAVPRTAQKSIQGLPLLAFAMMVWPTKFFSSTVLHPSLPRRIGDTSLYLVDRVLRRALLILTLDLR